MEEKIVLEKSGCVLVNKKNKTICLVKRRDGNGWEFPKGHIEKGENLEQCAIRETEEETEHICHIVKELYINKYITKNDITHLGKEINIKNHIFLAIDDGITKRKINEEDKEIAEWFKIEEIKDKLYFENLKKMWDEIKLEIINYLEK